MNFCYETMLNCIRQIWRSAQYQRSLRSLIRAALLCFTLLASAAPSLGQTNPSGLVLPRFASTRSTPINVRVGPGVKYEVAWIYLKAGVPVEIVQEFDTWRKIRDLDGSEGWVHQNLLSGNRAGYVAPATAAEVTLRSGPADSSGPRAVLSKGFRVQIKQCDGTWCEVTAINQPVGERSSSYSGYLHQADIWGVYPTENFD